MNGRTVYHPDHPRLPDRDGLSDEQAERHLAAGWVERTGTTGGEQAEPDTEAPAGNASRAEWSSYALTQGATEADLDGLSRNDIRDRYGD